MEFFSLSLKLSLNKKLSIMSEIYVIPVYIYILYKTYYNFMKRIQLLILLGKCLFVGEWMVNVGEENGGC